MDGVSWRLCRAGMAESKLRSRWRWRLCRISAPPNNGAFLLVLLHELAHVIDHLQAISIALFLRIAPRKQPVAAEDDAVASRIGFHGTLQHRSEFESGPLPRQPDHVVVETPVELVEFRLSIRARGDSDGPVRVQVIDMFERQESMKRRVDRCRCAARSEGAHG